MLFTALWLGLLGGLLEEGSGKNPVQSRVQHAVLVPHVVPAAQWQ